MLALRDGASSDEEASVLQTDAALGTASEVAAVLGASLLGNPTYPATVGIARLPPRMPVVHPHLQFHGATSHRNALAT